MSEREFASTLNAVFGPRKEFSHGTQTLAGIVSRGTESRTTDEAKGGDVSAVDDCDGHAVGGSARPPPVVGLCPGELVVNQSAIGPVALARRAQSPCGFSRHGNLLADAGRDVARHILRWLDLDRGWQAVVRRRMFERSGCPQGVWGEDDGQGLQITRDLVESRHAGCVGHHTPELRRIDRRRRTGDATVRRRVPVGGRQLRHQPAARSVGRMRLSTARQRPEGECGERASSSKSLPPPEHRVENLRLRPGAAEQPLGDRT